jgi:capsule polysaccharide export protein KpsC/LpsZ
VHDLTTYSDAVYVNNSGVGLEAILHGKPVVTFGQAEYDTVSVRGNLEALDDAWEEVRTSDPDQRLDLYRQYIDRYCRLYCADMSDPQARDARLRTVAEKAVKWAQTPGLLEPARI